MKPRLPFRSSDSGPRQIALSRLDQGPIRDLAVAYPIQYFSFRIRSAGDKAPAYRSEVRWVQCPGTLCGFQHSVRARLRRVIDFSILLGGFVAGDEASLPLRKERGAGQG